MRTMLVAASLSLAAVAGALALANARPTAFPLVVTPERLSFGTVTQGERHHKQIWLTNATGHPVIISAIDSSCPCLTLKPAKIHLAPGETISAAAELDLTREPGFTGRMSIPIRTTTISGQVGFLLTVEAVIAAGPSWSASQMP